MASINQLARGIVTLAQIGELNFTEDQIQTARVQAALFLAHHGHYKAAQEAFSEIYDGEQNYKHLLPLVRKIRLGGGLKKPRLAAPVLAQLTSFGLRDNVRSDQDTERKVASEWRLCAKAIIAAGGAMIVRKQVVEIRTSDYSQGSKIREVALAIKLPKTPAPLHTRCPRAHDRK